MAKKSTVPAHISDEMKALYRRVMRDFKLDQHHVHLLVAACEAHTRMTGERALFEAAALPTADPPAQIRVPPAFSIKRDSEIRSARLLRELNLENEPAE